MAKNKIESLQAFLGALPASVAARLARAIEVDRLNDGKMLPHDLILESLRPTLRAAAQANRTPTPMRAFCRPFEDFLVAERKGAKQKGRIARGSVTPVWNWLAQTLVPDALTAYAIAVKTAVLGVRTDEAKAKTVEFWTVAAQAIRSKLDSESGRRSARQVLGGESTVDDAREMALLLSIGSEICEFQDRLPRQLPNLTDEVIQLFREGYERVAALNGDAAPYLSVLVMNRLERPWEALRLALSIARKTQETLIASTDMGLVGELLFGDIEEHAAAIRTARPERFNADHLVAHVDAFTALTGGMVKEVELRRDGQWGQRLMKDRAAVGGVMDGFMEKAPREVLAALPVQKSGSFSGAPKTPDVSRPADPEKSDRALSYARLIAGCRRSAAGASFAASLKEAEEELILALKNYNDEIVRELRAAEGERRVNADQFFALAAELTALLFSPEEGEFLRRRGRAAVSAAVAA
ncbi:MAG TPA: hypothetical protein VIM02_08075 [Rhizomicrobium sp.]|jgi:hypothetical protein